MKRDEVYNRLNKERDYQDQVWGGSSHDKGHSVGDWLIYMTHYLDRAKIKHSTSFKSDDEALKEIRKAVALGIACFEQFGVPDREYRVTKNDE